MPESLKKSDVATSQVAADNHHRFREALETGHALYTERAKRNDKFYAGEQWDKADKDRLEREGRPALTLNLILSTVNAMIGEQLDRKVDAHFTPLDTGTEATAFALNKIARVILNENNYDDIEENVFSDGLIGGRGYFDVRMSFQHNIQGKVCISMEDPIDVIIDGEAKEMDPKTWNEVFISRWMTPDEIGATYGWDKVEKVQVMAQDTGSGHDDNFDFGDRTFGGDSPATRDNAARTQLNRVRVVERQFFKVAEQWFFVDPTTGALRAVPYGADEESRESFAQEYGFEVIKRKGRRVRMVVSCDDVLLKDDWSIYRSFTIVPFFPYFRRGNPFSAVDNLIDPQNLLNKTSSQELHIVNTTANSGWVLQEDSLVDMDAEDLEERGAETGLVLQYKRGYEKPEKITPNSIPTGIDRISQKAASTIREISSVNASMLGTARADQSGRAQEAATMRGQVQVSVVLSNLKRCRRTVLEKILELVQDFYTETRYFNIIGDDIMMSQGANEQVGVNVPQDDGNILNDITVGDYGTEVGYRPSGGSLADKEMDEAMRLREMGVAIPDHVMVQYSRLTKRMELAKFLKDSQGFGEQSEEQAALEELQMEHQIGMLQKELEKADADIEVARATALEKQMNAESLEDFNKADIEAQKLEVQRALKEKELSLRIALAARGHQNANTMNVQRLQTSVAMKSMDMAIAGKKEPPQPKSKDK